ncbi:methyl-accepting chemotaxis protein [Shewanella gaetbuli]
MIAILRQLTILKRLFIILILAAIGTVTFGSFSIKEQYDNLKIEKFHQLESILTQFNATVKHLNNHHFSLSDIINLANSLTEQSQYPIVIVDANKQILTLNEQINLPQSTINTMKDNDGKLSIDNLLEQSKSANIATADITFTNGSQQLFAALYNPTHQFYILASADSEDLNSTLNQVIYNYLIIMLLISAPIFLFFLLLNHSITQPINTVIATMKDIAAGEGDLRHRLDENGNDEVSELAKAFNMFVIKIANVVAELNPIVNKLNDNSAQLLKAVSTSQNSSNNVNQETQSVAAAIHEMLTTTQDMARNTQQTAESANDVTEQAKHGQLLMESTVVQSVSLGKELQHNVEVSKTLYQSSNEISSILEVIKSIAEQTNLLALNAAIEAARAGAHGRGFAVVADEVRALANRTQDSTNEISQIVAKIHKGIESLSQSNHQTLQQSDELQTKAVETSDAMEAILTLVANINDMTTQLASATEQQAMVTEEINKNITSITELTQQVVLTNQTNENEAIQLESISQTMDNTLKQFKI